MGPITSYHLTTTINFVKTSYYIFLAILHLKVLNLLYSAYHNKKILIDQNYFVTVLSIRFVNQVCCATLYNHQAKQLGTWSPICQSLIVIIMPNFGLYLFISLLLKFNWNPEFSFLLPQLLSFILFCAQNIFILLCYLFYAPQPPPPHTLSLSQQQTTTKDLINRPLLLQLHWPPSCLAVPDSAGPPRYASPCQTALTVQAVGASPIALSVSAICFAHHYTSCWHWSGLIKMLPELILVWIHEIFFFWNI